MTGVVNRITRPLEPCASCASQCPARADADNWDFPVPDMANSGWHAFLLVPSPGVSYEGVS